MAEPSDADLWEAFTASTLAHDQWTHRAHVRVAWLHLQRFTFDEAHLRIRASIIRLNASHGLTETPARGYHETMTRAWLALVAGLRSDVGGEDSRAFVDACGERLDKNAVRRHYSTERLTSVRARAVFVEPDLAPFAFAG